MKKAFQQACKGEQGSLEKELKYHLDREDYLKLIRAFRLTKPQKVRLMTYYFDDLKLRLRKRKFGFRVRTINGRKAFVTLKYPAKTSSKSPTGFKVRHEYEEEIPFRKAQAVLAGRKSFCEIDAAPVRLLKRMFSKDYLCKLEVLGGLQTVRTMVPLGKRFEMEIDSCKMFGKRFYELEIETEDATAADRAVRSLLKKHRIPYLPLEQSKLGRFIEEWKKLRIAAE